MNVSSARAFLTVQLCTISKKSGNKKKEERRTRGGGGGGGAAAACVYSSVTCYSGDCLRNIQKL